MANRSAELEMRISARADQAKRALEGVSRRTGQMGDRMERADRRLQSVQRTSRRAAMALAALTAALTVGVRRAAEYADRLEGAAAQTGIAADRMQALASVAEENHANFELLSTGLRSFTRRASEAARGNQQFLQGFEQLGMTQQDVANGLDDIEGLLIQVAGRTRDLGSAAEQSAALMRIMGDQGRQLVPFMTRLGDEGAEMLDALAETGRVLDRQTIGALSAFHDEMNVTQQRVSVASQEFFARFIPALTVVNEAVNDGIDAWRGLDDEVQQNIVRGTAMTAMVMGGAAALGVLATGLRAGITLLRMFRLTSLTALAPWLAKGALVGAAIWGIVEAINRLRNLDFNFERDFDFGIGSGTFRFGIGENPLGDFRSGTPFTGHGPLDEVAGVVHRREAVVPWEALRQGPAGVLDFLGMGFQSGRLTDEQQAIIDRALRRGDMDPLTQDLRRVFPSPEPRPTPLTGTPMDQPGFIGRMVAGFMDLVGIGDTAEAFRVGPQEKQMLARMVHAEAAGEPLAGKVGVAAVILNRVGASNFPNSIEGVITQPRQFEPMMEGGRFHTIAQPSDKTMRAVAAALSGDDPTGGALFFYNPDIVRQRAQRGERGALWMLENTVPTGQIGQHLFAQAGDGGFRQGGFTGNGPLDEVAGVVHRREAVIPWEALRRGPLGVLDFLGFGFQGGLRPDNAGPRAPGPSPSVGLIPEWIEANRLVPVELIPTDPMPEPRQRSATGRVFVEQDPPWLRALDEFLADMMPFLTEHAPGLMVPLANMLEMMRQAERLWSDGNERFQDFMSALDEGPGAIQDMIDSALEKARIEQEDIERQQEEAERFEQLNRRWMTAMEGFISGLDSGNQALDGFLRAAAGGVRFGPGGMSFDPSGLLDFGLGLVGNLLGGLLGGGAAERPIQPREFDAPDPVLQGGLLDALEHQERLEEQVPQLERQLGSARRALAEMDNAWDRMFHSDRFRERQRRVRELEQELQNLLDATEGFELREFLGFDPRSIAQSVESGFDMADPARLGASLEGVIETALVRAWTTSTEMMRLQDTFGEALADVMDDFIETGELDAEALDPLRDIIGTIGERGEVFADLLRELGFEVDSAANSMRDMNRNVPPGFRAQLARFRAATPNMDTAGAMQAVRAATSQSVNVTVDMRNANITDVPDVERRIERGVSKALRKAGMASRGVGVRD